MSRQPPRLVAITLPDPARLPGAPLLAALEPWVDLLLLRLPGVPAADYADHARRLLDCPRRPLVRLRAPAALAAELGADGVHLGEDDPDPATVAREWPGLPVSCSRHDAAGLDRCTGADFALLSPVAPTASKPGQAPRPLAELGGWVRGARLPVLALGGVEPGLVPALRAEGFAGVAAMRAVLGAADPVAGAAALRRAWGGG